MAKRSKRSNDGPHIFWRNGRAYADLRTYADIGGGREALATHGSTWGDVPPPAVPLAMLDLQPLVVPGAEAS
jgi:hypothetical protein